MNKKLNLLASVLLVAGLVAATTPRLLLAADQHEHPSQYDAELGNNLDDKPLPPQKFNQQKQAQAEHDEEGVVLTARQMQLANIQVSVLSAKAMSQQYYAPGEILANKYTSYVVSPRAASVVVSRQVALGDQVKKGAPLVTLFSETIANAQANFRVVQSEWRRVKALGKKTVGDSRYIQAKTDIDAATSRLQAYGLSADAIATLNDGSKKLGEYTLMALIDGVVLSDSFYQGQRVEAGERLIELANEHELWVEAKLAPSLQLQLQVGDVAKVNAAGESYQGLVAQEAHTIDPVTRTRIVRLTVANEKHQLHPGMFADVYFNSVTSEAVLAVPEHALIRSSDGDWTVFVEQHTGEFVAREVVLGRAFNDWREITGVAAGERVVTAGAFFVASQIAKGGFDPHNH